MKSLFCFFYILLIVSVCYADMMHELWGPSELDALPSDKKGYIPNDTSLPKDDGTCYKRSSISKVKIGTIRRVDDIPNTKVVALTFDMCELAIRTTGYNAAIVNFLRLHKIPATFFLGGKWMKSHPERAMQLIVDPLFEVGSHAWTHGNFGIMSPLKMREQILWTQAQYNVLRRQIIERIKSKNSSLSSHNIPECLKLFRLPYGRCTNQALAMLADLGLNVIQWDIVAERHQDNSLPGLEQDIVHKVRAGSIILFHANCVPIGSEKLLQRTVEALKLQGYQFVTVSELLTMGKPQYVMEGYFLVPGDNLSLDKKFGIDGTG